MRQSMVPISPSWRGRDEHSAFYWSAIAGILLAALLYATTARAQESPVAHVGDVIPLAHISFCTDLTVAEQILRTQATVSIAASQKLFQEDNSCDDDWLGFKLVAEISAHKMPNGRTFYVVEAVRDDTNERIYLLTPFHVIPNDSPA